MDNKDKLVTLEDLKQGLDTIDTISEQEVIDAFLGDGSEDVLSLLEQVKQTNEKIDTLTEALNRRIRLDSHFTSFDVTLDDSTSILSMTARNLDTGEFYTLASNTTTPSISMWHKPNSQESNTQIWRTGYTILSGRATIAAASTTGTRTMNITFSKSFATVPIVVCSFETSNPNKRIATPTYITAEGFTMNVYDELTNSVGYVDWMAIA